MTLPELKQRLYLMRNGIVADTLRKAGSPYSVIFGVNLPQLKEIAIDAGHDRELAQAAWGNATSRECMLVAPMIMPPADFTIDMARSWIDTAVATEAIDILCLKLLREQPYALALAQEMAADSDPMRHYAGLRLMCNIAHKHPGEAVAMGQKEMQSDKPLRQMATILLDYDL